MREKTPIKTWIVEDNSLFRSEVIRLIATVDDIDCTEDFVTIEQLEARLETATPAALPDVLLLDIMMPGKSGIDGAWMMRERFPEVAIVMLTSDDKSDTIYRALKAGARGYLLKSMAFDETALAIRQTYDGGMMAPPSVAHKVLRYFNTLPGNDKYQLTPRELEVLEKMADSLSQKGIAKALNISSNTVNQHIKNIYEKLQVNNRAGAVAKALRERIIE